MTPDKLVFDITIQEDSTEDSGIYMLTFSSGMFYIGKSIHIKERWKQHFDKFSKGKAAENMQREFNKYGYPSCKVLFHCHPDHIDILECYLIKDYAKHRKHMMLNTTYADAISDGNFNILDKNSWLLKYSTVAHVGLIKLLIDKGEEFAMERANSEYKLQELRENGLIIPEELEELNEELDLYQGMVEDLEDKIKQLEEELKPYKTSWWKRIFS